jgi:hypothetical protein
MSFRTTFEFTLSSMIERMGHMAEKNADLWPANFGDTLTRTPADVLKEQAAMLGPKTGNRVTAEVRSIIELDAIVLRFDLVVPALRNYRYTLFEVYHKVDRLYPVSIIGEIQQLADEQQLLDFVASELQSEETKRIVSTLLSQSRLAS